MIYPINKYFGYNKLYEGKPFIFYTRGSKMHTFYFIRVGRLLTINEKDDKYVMKWYPVTHNDEPIYITYTLRDLREDLRFYYAYGVGDKVRRVTDNSTHTVKNINFNPAEFYTEVEETFGQMSYSLYIPYDGGVTEAKYRFPLENDLFKL